MDQTGTLLSYIRESEAAQEALRLLGQKGYRKRVLLQRSAEGQIKRSDPNIRLRFILILVSGLMISAAGGILALAGYLPSLLPRFSTNLLLSIFLGFGVGMLLGWPAALVLLPGVSKTVTSHQSTWLRSGESLLILQAPLQSLSPAVKLLRDSIETEVSIFAQHPLRQFPGNPDLRELTALPLPQIKAFASHLAEEQQIEIQKRSRRDLLSKLDQARQIIHIICGDMSEALHLEQRLGPIGEWILDNEYLIESHGRDVKINLSKSFYRELPTLIGDPNRGSPRVYSLANELITHCDTRIDRENITAFLSAYQDHTPLTIGELWALPLMLRVALIHRIEDMARQAWQELREREFADFWANRLLSTLRRDPDQLFAVLADLAQERGRPSPYFAIQLSGHLYDEDAALVPVQSWLERTLQRPLTELHSGEQSRQAANQISIGNAITSLRQLSLLDWREVFEEQNRVELILRRDPAGFYSQMDFGTRNQYRDAVEVLAKRAGIAQIEIARKVVEMASAGKGSQDGLSRQRHVGTYLIGEGRRQFSKSLGCRENWRYLAKDWAYRHPAGIYLTSVTLLSMGLLAYPILDCLRFGASLFEQGVIVLLAFPASQIAVEVVNYLITRILPARRLPKLDFAREGIPDEYRTLVVVPILLTDEATIKNEIEKLEIRYVANPEQNLIFSLFSDFKDAPGETAPDDDLLLSITEEGIEELNAHYGEGRFYLFHRQRTWSETEERFIGWERKRGKLEELNRLILGLRGEDEPSIVYVGDEDRLTGIRYIITLDSDTQLPRDSARRMIETLAHPLNQPRLDKNGQIAQGSYTLLQPRVSPSLPSAVASTFSRIYTDPVGTDPYTRVVSNAYQDLSGEGSYIGKGIYDPRFFHTILADRFPDERLLSHDLIEGAHVRTGLATDIELFDEFPSDYISYSLRKHRWIRGDWQIADWIFPKVPTRNKTRVPNPLSLLNRWKIFDNLRRSLVPAASVGVLIGSWFIVNNLQPYVAVLIGSVIFFQSLTGPLTWATSRHGLRSFSFRQIRHDLTRALADTALLFHQAGLALDAILRVFYRRAISRRGLLEWTTAQMTEWGTRKKKNIFQYNFWLISLLSLGLGIGLFLLRPESLLFALPWLALWFSSPLVGWALTRKPSLRETEGKLSEHDIQSLRLIARRTWRYFADFMGPDTAWLPPDNYQVSHKDQVALRTSPTNIGLGMLSTLAAYDFGYQTLDQTIDRLSHTMATIKQLDRHEGHLLNWYSLDDLTTLNPRYVSSVDSGNFIAALWTLDQGLAEILEQPLLSLSDLDGLLDTGEILLREFKNEKLPPDIIGAALEVLDLIRECPSGALNLIRCIRQVSIRVKSLTMLVPVEEGARGGAAYWVGQLESEISAWIDFINRYLFWMEILAEQTESKIRLVGFEDLLNCLDVPPSLASLAAGQLGGLVSFDPVELGGQIQDPELEGWLERFTEAYSRGKWFAGEMEALAEKLQTDLRDFSNDINLRYLYDPDRRLFSVGYNVSSNQLDGSYYDLLASESRLGSFIAIARGDVPVEHWLSLNRPYSSHGQHRILLSWTGTMFEYLMPLLLQRTYPNSLLDHATREAAALQILYGRVHGVPWGISESAYGDLDLNKTYQYRAFGVPWLGLKRGLEEDLVVAPYATMLAVGLEPRAVIKNLNRLTKLGLFNDYGYFEAIDFNRRPRADANPGVIVRTYMAHHQGMSLLALGNILHGNIMQTRFHQDPRVRAAEPLLYERMPISPPLHHISAREEIQTRVGAVGIAPSISKFDSAQSITPKVQLLSNGMLSTMTTTAGGGYIRWRDMDVTRWRADTTRDAQGAFIYFRDLDSGQVWSNLYHPIASDPDRYTVHFPLDRAEYRRRDNGLETQTELIVSPEDDVEIRRITVTNRSLRTRRIQATSYYELALARHEADRQHPAFNKLFIQTEALKVSGALLAFRRLRQEDDPAIFAVHSLDLLGSSQPTNLPPYETDRRVFIGRGRSLHHPLGIDSALGNTQGYVLDPVFVLRREIQLLPGQSAQLISFLGVADSRQGALSLAEKYHDPAAVERAFEIAWASAQLELRLLRIHPDDARRFQKLAAYMLYPSSYLRPPSDRIEANRKGQSGLWPYGISGDLPILLVTIANVGDLGLVRQLLQAQAYWRRHGLATDLVILNEESSSYEQPLMERLERLVHSFSMMEGKDQPIGNFLLAVDQLPPQDLILLQSAARVSLVAARGPLAQQIGVPFETVDEPPLLVSKRSEEEPSRQLPFLELPYFNSLGGFSQDGREYVIYLGPEDSTPAPWVNVIANPLFGTIISETGAGFTWYGNSQRNRLTQWSNDPVLDPHSEIIYIRDEESGVFWNPTAGPIRERGAYRISHGAGYSRFEHNSHSIEGVLTIFVPLDHEGGEPLKICKLSLRNDSNRIRKLSITHYVEWTIGEQREASQQYIVTQWDPELGLILARNGYHPDYGERIAFSAISPSPDSFTCDRTVFLGRNLSAEKPAAMRRSRLAERSGAELDPCGALQTRIELKPGESAEVICLLGQAATPEEARDLTEKYSENLAVDEALEKTQHFWDQLLGAVQVETPELSTNFLLNRWLLYQSLSCRIWGRSAFYQSGGAFGFRDQLQDVAAFLLADPDLARKHILLAASRQFTEGDVQHWWHPPGGAGIRSRISDDLLWLPFITAQYVQVTGDESILQEQIHFLLSPGLEPGQNEIYLDPQVSLEKETLFDHCRRAVEKGLTRGPHGLPLIGTGDWNDGLNRVGDGGLGESVWLGWFLIEVLNRMERLAEIVGETELANHYRQESDELEARIDRSAWDGDWYLRGTFDDGSLLGSASNLEARIDSLAQSWPWISGAGDPARREQALESAWRELVLKKDKLVLLFTPPFDTSQPFPGYIRGYPPGVRENGGQYTHAAAWLALAFARKGDGNRAGEILRFLNPIEHTREVGDVWRYSLEPYIVAADVSSLPGRIGQGGWSWYTGSAAWIYRVWTEEVLGLKKRGDQLLIDPVIPDWWDGFKVQMRHENALYSIEVQNPDHVQQGVTWLELDGQRLDENFIILDSEPVKHILRVLMGKGNP